MLVFVCRDGPFLSNSRAQQSTNRLQNVHTYIHWTQALKFNMKQSSQPINYHKLTFQIKHLITLVKRKLVSEVEEAIKIWWNIMKTYIFFYFIMCTKESERDILRFCENHVCLFCFFLRILRRYKVFTRTEILGKKKTCFSQNYLAEKMTQKKIPPNLWTIVISI